MEDEESDEDEMEEDDIIPVAPTKQKQSKAAPPVIALNLSRIASASRSKKVEKSEPPTLIDTAEKLLNPQSNKERKKMLKQKKKQDRKLHAAMDQQLYDFAEHFDLPTADMDED
jgi:hypothetical protein